MKKKKDKKRSIYRNIRTTLLIGIAAFIILTLTLTIASWIFQLLYKYNLIDETNYKTVMFYDYAAVSTVIGCILSVIIIHRPMSRMQRLLDAMEQISNGNFSARLHAKSKTDLIKRSVAIFNNMATQLENINMLSHDFINNFSHEIKTPIASINGFAKLLKNENLTDEERNEYLDIIIQESDHLSNLSANILTLSRLEHQSVVTNKTYFNVSEQIRITIGSLYNNWSKKNTEIVFNSDEYYINANKEMIGQVWINLIDNAIKFSPDKTDIDISLKSDGETLIFSISNFGKPIPPENEKRIFDKFYQGDESHSTSGNGLGLPMVKKIVELHNGEIKLKTNNELITFEVSLPTE
ncbi:MAG: HAMP domain-containing histidine kinase [Clostridia bacterium]|nr:HAMP domain-containing histidine kinase [Clostridia bacterium]